MVWQEVLLVSLVLVRSSYGDGYLPHHPPSTLDGYHSSSPMGGRHQPVSIHTPSKLGHPRFSKAGPYHHDPPHLPLHHEADEGDYETPTQELLMSVHKPTERVKSFLSSRSHSPPSSFRSLLNPVRVNPTPHGDDYVTIDPLVGFEYEVHNDASETHFGHSEVRQGNKAEGKYFVELPDKRIQTVTYVADENGYFPTVAYEGGNHQSYSAMLPPSTEISHEDLFRSFKNFRENSQHKFSSDQPLKESGNTSKPKQKISKTYHDSEGNVHGEVKSSHRPLKIPTHDITKTYESIVTHGSNDSPDQTYTAPESEYQRPPKFKYQTPKPLLYVLEQTYNTARPSYQTQDTYGQKYSQDLAEEVYTESKPEYHESKNAYDSIEDNYNYPDITRHHTPKSVVSYLQDTYDTAPAKYSTSKFRHDHEEVAHQPPKFPHEIGRTLSQDFGDISKLTSIGTLRPDLHTSETPISQPFYGTVKPITHESLITIEQPYHDQTIPRSHTGTTITPQHSSNPKTVQPFHYAERPEEQGHRATPIRTVHETHIPLNPVYTSKTEDPLPYGEQNVFSSHRTTPKSGQVSSEIEKPTLEEIIKRLPVQHIPKYSNEFSKTKISPSIPQDDDLQNVLDFDVNKTFFRPANILMDQTFFRPGNINNEEVAQRSQDQSQ